MNCLAGIGCIHARTEWFMHTGRLAVPPDVVPPCETQCRVCTGSYATTFLPMIYSGVADFFLSTDWQVLCQCYLVTRIRIISSIPYGKTRIGEKIYSVSSMSNEEM